MQSCRCLQSKGGKYLKLDNPALKKGVKQAKALNARGKTNQFIAGALAGGVGEGVFVGDVEEIGSFGDLLGGPTEIDRGDDPDAAREILNRVKFGTEGALVHWSYRWGWKNNWQTYKQK